MMFGYITGTGWALLVGLDAAVCGFFAAWLAEGKKGLSSWAGGLLGFFLGPIGVLVVAVYRV